MKNVRLSWSEPYSVATLIEDFKQSYSFSDKKYPDFYGKGLYMYLDWNYVTIVYIGQAFDKTPRSLRNRVRWEILKDGMGCAQSKFHKDCQQFYIDKNCLFLKVACIKEATENGIQILKDDYELLNIIEMALIHEVSMKTDKQQPIINKKGKNRYRRESIEIHNIGSSSPLPKLINK